MGMGERKDRAEQFEQQTAKVRKDLNQPDLFSSKPVEEILTFECLREPEDAPIATGDQARLIDMHDRIEVYIGVNSVGRLLTNDLSSVRDILKTDKRKGRSVSATVIELSGLTPTFIVAVKI